MADLPLWPALAELIVGVLFLVAGLIGLFTREARRG